MPQVKLVTDSTAEISPELAESLNISVLPLTIQLGNKSYREGIDIDAKEFITKIANTDATPILVPPTVAQFEQTLNELMKQTNEIVMLFNSSKLSRTFQNAHRAAMPLMGRAKIRVIDSQLISTGLGMIAT